MPTDTQLLYQQAADILSGAKHGVALTGAGISTPSGIPDFRSPTAGLWEDVDPMTVASIYGFRRDPKQFYEWMRPLARLMLDAEPNPAHHALAALENMGHINALVTQNIDTLHSRAGSNRVFEVHGHMRDSTCIECFKVQNTDQDAMRRYLESGEIPRCRKCGGILKPNVILFGEQLPVTVLLAAQDVIRNCDVLLIAGSSLVVAPVSELPRQALAHNAKIIIINYERTYIDRHADVVIHEDLAQVLPRIVELLEGKGNDTI